MSDELVVLRTFNTHVDADLAQSALEAVGIQSFVRADDAGGMETGLWIGNGVQILVREEDVPRADEILNVSASDT